MRKQLIPRPVVLRFKRWSRKGYAAFVSMHHVVTIGQLSAHVSERFQVKNGAVHASVITFDKAEEGRPEEKEEKSRPGSPGGSGLALFLCQPFLCPVRTANLPAAAHAQIIKIYLFVIAEGPGPQPGFFRDFRFT